MKTDSTHSKYIPGEFRWMYWDNQSNYPQTGDGFYYSLSLIMMLNAIISLHVSRLSGLNYEYIFDICCGVLSAATWTLFTFIRLHYLRRSPFWALLILPQPLLLFYQAHHWRGLLVVFVILATTLVLYLIKPRSLPVGQTPSMKQPIA